MQIPPAQQRPAQHTGVSVVIITGTPGGQPTPAQLTAKPPGSQSRPISRQLGTHPASYAGVLTSQTPERQTRHGEAVPQIGGPTSHVAPSTSRSQAAVSISIVVTTVHAPAAHVGVVTSRKRMPVAAHESRYVHAVHIPRTGSPQSVSTAHTQRSSVSSHVVPEAQGLVALPMHAPVASQASAVVQKRPSSHEAPATGVNALVLVVGSHAKHGSGPEPTSNGGCSPTPQHAPSTRHVSARSA
jgi:hypothetical protein